MRSRSWTAALVLLIPAALVVASGLASRRGPEDDPPADTPMPAAAGVAAKPDHADPDAEVTAVNKIRLVLNLTGVGPNGGTIEIKPGHAGCRFETVNLTLPRGAASDRAVRPRDDIEILAQSLNADRDCTFAITVQEPGQEPKTYRRGLRLIQAEEGKPSPEQTLNCTITTPSIAARDTGSTRLR